MTERIVLSIVAVIMFVLSLKKGEKSTIFLTSGLTIGILITWAKIPIIVTAGLLIYMLSALFIIIINIKSKGLTKYNKLTIIVSGLFTFGTNLFSIMHWPYANIVRLSVIIPLVLYLGGLLKGGLRIKEVVYLTIMHFDFLMRLLR